MDAHEKASREATAIEESAGRIIEAAARLRAGAEATSASAGFGEWVLDLLSPRVSALQDPTERIAAAKALLLEALPPLEGHEFRPYDVEMDKELTDIFEGIDLDDPDLDFV